MRLLLVAYYYPPINSGGTERPLKMMKFLPGLGHEVSVVTCDYAADRLDAPEYRVRDISHNFHRVGRYRLQWLILRLVSGGLNSLGFYHSIYSSWRNRVLRLAGRIVQDFRPQAVLATYPPVENLEIGLALASRHSLFLVSDFRDGLLFEPVERDHLARYGCVRRRYATVERDVAARSAAVVTAFPSVTAYFREHYGLQRVSTVTNGYDEEDHAGLGASDLLDRKRFNIVHTGRFGGSYSGRDVGPLCDALRSVVSADDEFAGKLRLHLVGPLDRRERRRFSELIDMGVVRAHGLCPRPTALASQLEADALLLMTGTDRPGNAPGKLFEYLRAGRPIIGLTKGSYSEEIIRDTGTGWTVDPADETAIAAVLREAVIAADRPGALAPKADRIEEFSRRRQIEKLAEVIDSLEGESGTGTGRTS